MVITEMHNKASEHVGNLTTETVPREVQRRQSHQPAQFRRDRTFREEKDRGKHSEEKARRRFIHKSRKKPGQEVTT